MSACSWPKRSRRCAWFSGCQAPGASVEAVSAKAFAVRAAEGAAEAAVRLQGWSGLADGVPGAGQLAALRAAEGVGGPADALVGRVWGEVARVAAA